MRQKFETGCLPQRHRERRKLPQSPTIAELQESRRARVVTKRVAYGELAGGAGAADIDQTGGYRQIKQCEAYKLAERRFFLTTGGRDSAGLTRKYAYDTDVGTWALEGTYRHSVQQNTGNTNFDATCAETLPLVHDAIVGGQRISHQFVVGMPQSDLWPLEAWRESGNGTTVLWRFDPSTVLQPWPVDIMPTRRADSLNGAPLYAIAYQHCAPL